MDKHALIVTKVSAQKKRGGGELRQLQIFVLISLVNGIVPPLKLNF